MTDAPILAARSLPAGTDGYRVPLTFRVEGGLHYIAGNRALYFSLTYTQHRKGFPGQCYSGDAGHDVILRYFPRFADLAALHGSDIDGVPMHAEANGWYWLAGALGGADERYHGGGFHPFLGDGKSEPECLAIFAKECRITLGEADVIASRVLSRQEAFGWGGARQLWAAMMADMRPRWKAEAEAAIARHNLHVYGDTWPREEVEA